MLLCVEVVLCLCFVEIVVVVDDGDVIIDFDFFEVCWFVDLFFGVV